ncbi:CocE/NonD family hydrolase [Mesorhizobium onobrychidis]|uniref:CocE/NonD family hydrolase n=1 Tax=Mesorhizobium onobrychidis TaxID=2775404 RepID=A0ABY5QZ00_9HYPH|nr:CocE/NonD family hydrolase [Mesorhizobium onobrychidis]UVC15881.1 CocE/NonD family hydrolase [Mesorhizobium onobrychidis]
MKTVTEFPRKVVEFPDMGIVMPDGCRLSARLWMPADAADDPVPAILEHLPYRKRDGTIFRDQLTHPYFAGHGYASIRVDMRGNGDSEGLMDDEYSEQELQDACNVIAWAAAQPWCNGNVGMMGISWGGFNCLQTAAKQPPALKAVISLCSTVDRYADDIHYKGGCLLIENFGWASTMLSYSSRPPDPLLAGDNRWRDLWLTRLENQPFLAPLWLKHQHRDAYWKRGSICEDYSAIQAAVLSIGGWHDGYRNTISHLAANIEAPVKGIVGPWIHKYPHYAAPEPRIGFLQEALRWWDRWLKGTDTGVEADPAYRAYVMDSVRPARWHPERPGRWVADPVWPSPDIKTQEIELIPEGSEPVIVASPQSCGLAGGEYFPFTFGPELPGDQRPDDALSVCFDQPVLTEAIDIVGAPEVLVRVSSDRRQANIAIRLCDVHPDGASELISYGVLNLTHRNSHEFPQALVPGETVTARVVLDQCAYRVPAGHRLRIAVSNAYWPMIWPSPEPVRLDLATATLMLPLRPLAQGDEVTFPTPEAAAPWATETIRSANSERRVDRDEKTGKITLSIVDDFGEVRDLEHGLANGSIARETWAIHPDDPLSASGKTHWTQTLSRNGWSVRTVTSAEMRSDAQNFMVNARIEAYEGEKLVFERNFDEKIPRALL